MLIPVVVEWLESVSNGIETNAVMWYIFTIERMLKMEEGKERKIKMSMVIAPIVSVAAFLMLIFGAGYAYFTSTVTMNSANYAINMPATTSLVCTKTDCNVTITPDMMTNTNTSSSVAKGTSTCSVECTCSGTSGATCAYNVGLTAVNAYIPSTSLGSNKEFTVTVTSPSGCTATNSSATETQVNTQAGKVLSTCNLTVGGTDTATVSAVFKWYNLDLDQTVHAGHSYEYSLDTTGGTVG